MKKKAKKNADFMKRKLKVGKALKPANLTDLSQFKAKRLKIVSSLVPTSDEGTSTTAEFVTPESIRKTIALIQHANLPFVQGAVNKLRQFLERGVISSGLALLVTALKSEVQCSGDHLSSLLDNCLSALANDGKHRHAATNEQLRDGLHRLCYMTIEMMEPAHLRSRFELIMTRMCLLVNHRTMCIVEVGSDLMRTLLTDAHFAHMCRSSPQLNAVILKYARSIAKERGKSSAQSLRHLRKALWTFNAYLKTMCACNVDGNNEEWCDEGGTERLHVKAENGNSLVVQNVHVPAWHRHMNSIVPSTLNFAFCYGAEAGMMTMAVDGCAEANGGKAQTASTLQTDPECMKEVSSVLIPAIRRCFDSLRDTVLDASVKKYDVTSENDLVTAVKMVHKILNEAFVIAERTASIDGGVMKEHVARLADSDVTASYRSLLNEDNELYHRMRDTKSARRLRRSAQELIESTYRMIATVSLGVREEAL